MGFKAISTSRSTATTAVSKQATIVNSGSGFAVTGATITANSSISINVNTPGQAPDTQVAGLSISSINYLNANGSISTANAVSTTTGGNIKINGAGFSSPMTVTVGGTTLANANVTVANTTAIIASLGNASPGNVSIATFNSTGSGAQLANAVFYSGVPVWTTTSFALTSGTAANVALLASSDSTLTYTLQAGSTLPTGMSLISTGYVSGTPTGYASSTSSTVVIVATDLENQATQQTITWSVQVGDPQFYYTTLLLNGDGTNGAQNNTFLDSSTNNFTITRFGNTGQGTYSPYSVTGWSNYFSGSLNVPNSAALDMGSGAYTVEGWFSTITTAGQQTIVSFLTGLKITVLPSLSVLRVWGDAGTTYESSSTVTINVGQWYHVAWVRQSTSLGRLYLNGTLILTVTSGSIVNSMPTGQNVLIGTYGDGFGNGFNGYLSNIRILKGTALYTSAFTPPTAPLTAISGTSLLTCQSNRFIDNSSVNAALTINGGTPSVQAFSPFNPGAAYSPSSYGGSAYFDGTGDYLTSTLSSGLGSGNFTVECWVNFTSTKPGDVGIFQIGNSPTAPNESGIGVGRTSGQPFLVYNNAIALGDKNSDYGVWSHVAVVRQSGTIKLYVNGVQAASVANSTTYTETYLLVGGYYSTASSTYLMSGYISSLRVVPGTAVYTSAFTPPTVPLTAIANTSLLLNFTNAGIIDQHSTNVLETVGNAQISTSVKKYGTGSIALDGTGDFLQYPLNPLIPNNTESFTIECWLNVTANKNYNYIFSAGYPIQIYMDANGNIATAFNDTDNSSTYFGVMLSTTTVTPGTWYHVAITRSGSNFYLFVNGVNESTASSSNNILLSTFYKPTVGDALNTGTSQYCFNGYIDDLRITKGFARYTANFTPPASGFLGQ